MNRVILAAFVAVAVTAGIAAAGIASLADAATTLINATGQSGLYDNAGSLGGCHIGGAGA